MNKFYNISDIQFDNDYLIVRFDHSVVQVKISDVSQKLLNASDSERLDYKISPSGYGINWVRLDEDLSINGLIKSAKSADGYFEEVNTHRSKK
jgi:hypothetical protein